MQTGKRCSVPTSQWDLLPVLGEAVSQLNGTDGRQVHYTRKRMVVKDLIRVIPSIVRHACHARYVVIIIASIRDALPRFLI